MKLFKKILTLITLFLSYSDSKDIRVFEILPSRPNSMANDRVVVELDRNITFQRGYALCLRIKFKTWDKTQIIYSRNISLVISDDQTGSFTNGRTNHYFTWDKSMVMIPTYWNSICVSYDEVNLSFNLSINAVREVSSLENEKITLNRIAPNELLLAGTSFTGQISDFNIWNRDDIYKIYHSN